MTENPFATPGTSDIVPWAEVAGRLLVVEPRSVETNVPTTLGEKDAVRADVHVIDGANPATYHDALIFPRFLQAQLRSRIGAMVLGRLEQGVAKAGQNPPWRLAEATAADQAAGKAWLAKRQTSTFSAPASTSAPISGEPPF